MHEVFDQFKWLNSIEQIKLNQSPSHEESFNFGIAKELIVKNFYIKYIRPFGLNYIRMRVNELPKGVAKEWANFCLEKYPHYIQIENEIFDENLMEICNEQHLSYTLLNAKFEKYKPFLCHRDYFQFAYDKMDSPDIEYFFILLIICIDLDYPVDCKKDFPINYRMCKDNLTCEYAEKCQTVNNCLLADKIFGTVPFEKEMLDFQKDITESFLHFAHSNIKERSLIQLYKSFEQINKTNRYKTKLSLSFRKVLYNNKFPINGYCFIQWDKVNFHDGYYTIQHPSAEKGKAMLPYKVIDPKSRKVFNEINSYFLKTMPPLSAYLIDGRIQTLLNKANLEACITIMEHKISAPSTIERKNINAPTMTRKELSKSMAKDLCKNFKSRFLDYLCSCQLENYKIICCIENRVNSNMSITNEYSFIFTFKESGNLLYLAFENATDSRCTYVFPIPKDQWKICIEALYNFFASNEINKRQSLSQRLIDLELPGDYDYKRVLHTNYLSWIDKIKYI